MAGDYPPIGLRLVASAFVLASALVHIRIHIATYGRSWRGVIKQSPITPAWWADAILQSAQLALQVAAVAYIWIPIGYSIDNRKNVLVRTVGTAWALNAVCLIAADLAHASLGLGPLLLTMVSLLGAVTGLVVLFLCLKRLHPLMVRLHKQDGGLANNKSRLVRAGTSWSTAYLLFRLPTGAAAALCACRAAVDMGSISLVLSGAQARDWVQPTLGMLVVVMVVAIGILSYLDDVAFVVTVALWLMGLIVATHTLLMTKVFCIALVLGLAMRTAFKYVPDDDAEVQSKKQ